MFLSLSVPLVGAELESLPFPFGPLTPSSEQGPITTTGTIGKAQAWVFVDWSARDEANNANPGQNIYWSFRYHGNNTRTGDCRIFLSITIANGGIPGLEEGKEDHFAKSTDNSGGILRAFAGVEADGVVIIVEPSGKVIDIRRHSGDFKSTMDQVEKMVDTATPIIVDSASVPPACAPALLFLKCGNHTNALQLAMKKLGADGKTLALAIAEGADAKMTTETARLADVNAPTGERFLTARRLEGLLQDFPKAPSAKAARDTMKVMMKEPALQAEVKAWGALEGYLAQAVKQSPSKLPAFQMAFLTAIAEKCPGTEAARIAELIRSASRLNALPAAP